MNSDNSSPLLPQQGGYPSPYAYELKWSDGSARGIVLAGQCTPEFWHENNGTAKPLYEGAAVLPQVGEAKPDDVFVAVRDLAGKYKNSNPEPQISKIILVGTKAQAEAHARKDEEDYHNTFPFYRQYQESPMYEWRVLSVPAAAPASLGEAKAVAPKPMYDPDDLDFEPDEFHTVSDMANVGFSLMKAIKNCHPDYSWSTSPAEIVGDLMQELEDLREDVAAPVAQAPPVVAEKDALRFVVLKASGSRYAYVNDTQLGKTIKRYDIIENTDGWSVAEGHAEQLNRVAMQGEKA